MKNINYWGKRAFPSAWLVIFVLTLVMTGFYGAELSFGVFLKPILGQFGWSRAAVAGSMSTLQGIAGLLGIIAGALADRYGARVVIAGSALVGGMGYMLMSQVDSIWQIYLFYGVIIGIGMSGLWIPLLSPVSRWFVTRRSLMTGIVICGLTLGQLAAPPIIGRMIAAYDWRQSYIILGIIVLVVIVIAAQFLRRDPARLGLKPYGAGNERLRNAPQLL